MKQLRARTQGLGEHLMSNEMACSKAAQLLTGAWGCIDDKLKRCNPEIAAHIGCVSTRLTSKYASRLMGMLGNLETLELGQLQLDIPFLGFCGQAVATQLEQHISKGLEGSNVDSRLASAELLDRFRSNKSNAPAWEVVVLETLDDPELASSASRLFGKGEAFMRSFGALQNSAMLHGVLNHLEHEDLEGKMLNVVSRLDTGALLSDFDEALISSKAREGFANQLLECCLDGLLDVAPSIRVPEVSGVHHHTAYRVLDLDMSGLRFRKEDVQLSFPNRTSGPAAAVVQLEARNVSAEFGQLRCFLKPKLLPEISVLTRARAVGITLHVGLAWGPSVCTKRVRLEVVQLHVGMDSLEISLDSSKCARLFNSLIGYLNESLKAHICKCLEVSLKQPIDELCLGIDVLLADAGPFAAALGLFRTQ